MYKIFSGRQPKPQYQKIGFFSTDNHHCTHITRQLPNGNWTSKLGTSYDIEHSLEAMEGGIYGNAVFFMEKNLEQ